MSTNQKPQDGGESSFGNKIKLTGGKAGGFKTNTGEEGVGGKAIGEMGGINGNNGTCEESVIIGIIYTGKGGKSVISDTSEFGYGRGARRR